MFSRCILSHPDAAVLEEWIGPKDYSKDEKLIPKWHIPCDEEVLFTNELLDIHFKSALDDLLNICQNKIHTDQGRTHRFLLSTIFCLGSALMESVDL